MSAVDAARGRKIALNQSRFRSSNGRLRAASEGHRPAAEDRVPFVCECADRACLEMVMLSPGEYERVRSHAGRFLLAAGHKGAAGAAEQIVEAGWGYVIVEKVEAPRAETPSVARPLLARARIWLR